jgi:hypothetical protein
MKNRRDAATSVTERDVEWLRLRKDSPICVASAVQQKLP